LMCAAAASVSARLLAATGEYESAIMTRERQKEPRRFSLVEGKSFGTQ
jgi:hypothetical protein